MVHLTWSENGKAKSLVTTPGHEFLCEDGSFTPVGDMVRNGVVRIVLASGEAVDCDVEAFAYSAETARLFEGIARSGQTDGSLALKAEEGWQTYNFEVADLHTYVAEGVRVHNTSGPILPSVEFTSGHIGTGQFDTASGWNN